MNTPTIHTDLGWWLMSVPPAILVGFVLLGSRRALALPLLLSVGFHAAATRALQRPSDQAIAASRPDGLDFMEFQIDLTEPVPDDAPDAARDDAEDDGAPHGIPGLDEHMSPRIPDAANVLPVLADRTPEARPRVKIVRGAPPVDAVRWAQAADVSSIISQRLKAAGGREGPVTISIVWFTEDDLDLHVIGPDGKRIFWRAGHPDVLKLDVDRNRIGTVLTRQPIENIRWLATDDPLPGTYQVFIDDYEDRSTPPGAEKPVSVKYLIRILVDGKLKALKSGAIVFQSHDDLNPEVAVGTFTYDGSH